MASVMGAAVVLPRGIESSTNLSATATLAALVFHTGVKLVPVESIHSFSGMIISALEDTWGSWYSCSSAFSELP
ncbi:hypothetical protein EC919_114126 [Pseudomonas graminis]|nr:hypothetical protein EC919_114126 [Pseudomonas graminis]